MSKRDEIRKEIENFRQKESLSQLSDERFGAITGKMQSGPRILFLDDHWDVISHLVGLEEKHATSQSDLTGQFVFFRISDVDGARFSDFYSWLDEWCDKNPPFDTIYVDGDLGPEGDGNMLCKHLRQKERYRYQPLALITADESFFRKQQKSHDGVRILGKFDQDTRSENVIKRLIIEHEDVRRQTQEKIWTDFQTELSRDLEKGIDAQEVARKFGGNLMRHLEICAWYLREMRGDTLVSIASDDELFQAGEALMRLDAPLFLRNLFDGKSTNPWHVVNDIPPEQAMGRSQLVGFHAIAASLGGRLLGDVPAVFTAYRKNEEAPFDDDDARRLHHAAILLRLAMGPERTNRRLADLSDTIKQMLDSDQTGKIVALLCDFLHGQFQIPLSNQGALVKTTSRLFLRGSGEIHRWGEQFRITENSLRDKTRLPEITINSDCVYARAIIDAQTRADWMESERGKRVEMTGTRQTMSYLTVPLLYDGAVLGAVNLECTRANAYLRKDVPLVEAVARVAAAAILNLRMRRFLSKLTELAVRALDSADLPQNRTDRLLEDGAEHLYELIGFSDMLLFERRDGLETPWQIIKAWKGDGALPVPRPLAEWVRSQEQIDNDWQGTFLYHSLSGSGDDEHFSLMGRDKGLPDNGDGNLRSEERPTWRHVVSLVGPPDARTRALELLFEHPHPMPEHFRAVLGAYARFIDMVYASSEANANMGVQLSTARIEARAGKVFSQFRHNTIHLLINIFDALDNPEDPSDEGKMIENAKIQLQHARAEMDRARALLRTPKLENFDLSKVWNELVKGASRRAKELGIDVREVDESMNFQSDPDFNRFILQNLLDNALVHGSNNGVKTIRLSSNTVSWWVCDDGAELPKELREKLFALGTTTKSQAGGHALFMSRELAGDLGADLSYERRNDKNCFVVRFRSELS